MSAIDLIESRRRNGRWWLAADVAQGGGLSRGRLGGICNSLGPYTVVLGPVPVCAESLPKQGSVFAYVLPSTTKPRTLSLTDGEVLDPASSFEIGGILGGQKLVVCLLPQPVR